MDADADDPLTMRPPWQVFPALRADEFARHITQGTGEAWFEQQWHPFWRGLGDTQRGDYLEHWQASTGWRDALSSVDELIHLDIDADAADAEAFLAQREAAKPRGRGWFARFFGRGTRGDSD